MDKIPKVIFKDIERIIGRDFGKSNNEKVLSQLEEYGTEEWHSEKLRVWSAILKLANKEIDNLSDLIEIAKNDYRDVLGPTEYPIFWEMGFSKEEKLSHNDRNKYRKENWNQYQEWFNSK